MMRNKHQDYKEHYRLYKSGKIWVSTLIFASGLMGIGMTATPVSASEGEASQETATLSSKEVESVKPNLDGKESGEVTDGIVDNEQKKPSEKDSSVADKASAQEPKVSEGKSTGNNDVIGQESSSEKVTESNEASQFGPRSIENDKATLEGQSQKKVINKDEPQKAADVGLTPDDSNQVKIDELKQKIKTGTKISQTTIGLVGDPLVNQKLSKLNITVAGLKTDSYIVKAGIIDGKNELVIAGVGQAGLMYGINTAQKMLSQGQDITRVDIEETPQMDIRGVIEGFYGYPWTDDARKDMFKFMGEHQMNVYIYSPKDDKYLRENWRELYPDDKLAALRELVETAEANHVEFVYTLSPGNDITYSSQSDYDATVAKFEQLRKIGVKQFYIALDDIPLETRPEDQAKFPNHGTTHYPRNSWSGLADAQSYYLNAVQRNYIKAHHLPNLWLVPTNYSGSKQDPFKEAQGESLDDDIWMQWTGEKVFSDKVTSESVGQAKVTYGVEHLFIWDNFPTNDANQDRLYLNPIAGRDANLYQQTDGFTANPLNQPYASWISLATFADYMWNADRYNQNASLKAIVNEMAGSERATQEALEAFVDLSQYWDHGANDDARHAPQLSALIQAYEAADKGTIEYQKAYEALKNRLTVISNLQTSLKKMSVQGFYSDSIAWINAASHWGKAALSALTAMNEVANAKPDDAVVGKALDAIDPEIKAAQVLALPNQKSTSTDLVFVATIGDGVFQQFIADSFSRVDQWLAMQPLGAVSEKLALENATTNMKKYQNNPIDFAVDGDLTTRFYSNHKVAVGNQIVVKLKDPSDIQRIMIHQGLKDDETNGDMFGAADVLIGSKADLSDLKKVGSLTAKGVVQVDLSAPMVGQYVVIRATKATEKWVQLREVEVFGPTGDAVTNITSNDSTGNIFDLKTETNFTGRIVDSNQSMVVEQTSPTPLEGMQSVIMVGHATGSIYVHSDAGWQLIGKTDGKQAITRLQVTVASVDGLRFVADSPEDAIAIRSLGFSTNAVPVTPDKPETKPDKPETKPDTPETKPDLALPETDKSNAENNSVHTSNGKTDSGRKQDNQVQNLSGTNQIKDGALPQTGETNQSWLSALGIFLLGLSGMVFGFKKHRD